MRVGTAPLVVGVVVVEEILIEDEVLVGVVMLLPDVGMMEVELVVDAEEYIVDELVVSIHPIS